MISRAYFWSSDSKWFALKLFKQTGLNIIHEFLKYDQRCAICNFLHLLNTHTAIIQSILVNTSARARLGLHLKLSPRLWDFISRAPNPQLDLLTCHLFLVLWIVGQSPRGSFQILHWENTRRMQEDDVLSEIGAIYGDLSGLSCLAGWLFLASISK